MLKKIARNYFHKIRNLYFKLFTRLPKTHVLGEPVYASQLHGSKKWDKRACGIACVYMVLKTVLGNGFKKTIPDLVKEGLAIDGYHYAGDVGWHHWALSKIAEKYGIKSRIQKYMPPTEIYYEIANNNYVISSVKSRTGGHLLLIYGYDTESVYFHDPYDKKKNGKSRKMKKEQFEEISRNKAIILSSG